jgi:hypothetical protein
MRYKVKAPTDESYRDFLSLLDGKVELFLASPKRRLLATGKIPTKLRGEIRARGGRISRDPQYHLESTAGT